MKRLWSRLIKAVLLLYMVYVLYFLTNQVRFERFLNTLYITFNDFPPDYSSALLASVADNKPIEYNHSLFPVLDDPSHAKTIPPIIHFIWFKDLYETHPERTKIPSIGSDAPRLCRETNPDFEINIWNATAARALIEKDYAWFLPTYDGYKHPIQRVDAFKYFVLWHHGGVYMDLDIACRRSLAPLMEFPAWFPRASPLGVNNDLMASRAHHPAIGKMATTLEARNWDFFFPYLTIFWSTGPQFTSDVLKMWFREHSNEPRYVPGTSKQDSDPDRFYVLPQEFYSEKYTYFGHSPGGTWHGEDVAVVLWLVDRRRTVLACVIFVVMAGIALAMRRRIMRRFRKAPSVEDGYRDG